jgi:hypothetical protein
MFKKMTVFIGALLLNTSLIAGEIAPIRVQNLTAEYLSKIQKGEITNTIIEFIEGDQLPINIKAEGDLFESMNNNPTFVEVKKHFFVKIMNSTITMSFDGTIFKPIQELLGGTLSVDASSSNNDNLDFPASVINLVFNAFIK